MKKTVALLLALLLLLGTFAGCAGTPEPTTEEDSTLSAAEAEKAWLRENLPKMDGSTSLIPLEAGVRSALFGIPFEEARTAVDHSTTWMAFYNLTEGEADLIFSCPLSDAQRQLLAEQNVTLAEVPVAMEAFVFAVNADNPVDTLTQQQLKDIYAGKITNWAQLGGNDEEIVAYQRNADSGSQNYMIDFMGDTPLADPPSERVQHSMGGLMDAIAVNDNASNAIGYSVYAYAADMYQNSDLVKFVKVDGVAPDRSTIASGEYPLLGYNYAMYLDDLPEDAAARRMVDYILSDEGQRAVADAGYVAVREIGYDYTPKKGALYTALGKGGPAPEAPDAWECVLNEGEALELGKNEEVTFLADQTLQAEVNAFIAEERARLQPEVDALLAAKPALQGQELLRCCVSARNGYLSAAVFLEYWSVVHCFPAVSAATWDLRTGRRLDTADLFFDGVEIGNVLSLYVSDYVQKSDQQAGSIEYVYDIQGSLTALPETGWCVTADGIYFDMSLPFFPQGAYVPFDGLPLGTFAPETAYDMRADLTFPAPGETDGENVLAANLRFVAREDHLNYLYLDADEAGEFPCISIALLDEDACPAAKAINRDVTAWAERYFSRSVLEEYVRSTSENAADDVYVDFYGFSVWEVPGRYVFFRPNGPWLYGQDEYPYRETRIYDLQTGALLDWTALLKDGWQDHASVWSEAGSVQPADTVGMKLEYIGSSQGRFYIILIGGVTLYVPFEYVNF